MFLNIIKKYNLLHGIAKPRHNLCNIVKFRTCSPALSKTKYGGHFTVTMVRGDDFHPKMAPYIVDIFHHANVPVNFETVQLDQSAESMEEVVTSIKRNGVAMKGNISTLYDIVYPSRNVILRRKLGLFANVLHCKSQPGILTRHKDIDLILIRQNTEGEYSCIEHEIAPGVVESLKIVTKERTEEIARFAFQYASVNKRRKITSVHKAHKMPMSDGLFIDVCRVVAKEYPAIEFVDKSMDNCCSELLTKPKSFDVFLLPNLYGNILDNLASGLIGGAGLVSGANYGHDCALFETGCRSSAALDNPVAAINGSVGLLHFLGLKTHAEIIQKSLHKTLNIDRILTPDVGGDAQAADVVRHVIRLIKEGSDF